MELSLQYVKKMLIRNQNSHMHDYQYYCIMNLENVIIYYYIHSIAIISCVKKKRRTYLWLRCGEKHL